MTTGTVEYTIRAWKQNLVKPGEEQGHVLVMPGTGYNCDRPLLYWSAQALVENGWYVHRLNVVNGKDNLTEVTTVLDQAVDEWRESVCDEMSEHNRPSSKVLLIGKSLTTLTYPHAKSLDIPMVLLTPVLNPAPFDPSGLRIEVSENPNAYEDSYEGAPLICAGTADPYFDEERARILTPHVHTYPDANHSIEVPGDWRRSQDYLKEVTASVEQYAAAL